MWIARCSKCFKEETFNSKEEVPEGSNCCNYNNIISFYSEVARRELKSVDKDPKNEG